MPHRTFGIEEAARYLHLQPADVEQLVQDREIPFERHGGRIVFRKLEMDSWASPRILGLQERRLAEYHAKSSRGTEPLLSNQAVIAELIQPDWIDAELAAKTRASVLREMVALAKKTGRVYDPPELLAGLEAREALCSTGLPGGFALLHTRHPDVYLLEAPFIVLGRTVQQIPFGAPDGRATDLFFLLACPDDRLHLHILARLCVLMKRPSLLDELRAAPDGETMHQRLVTAEQAVLEQL